MMIWYKNTIIEVKQFHIDRMFHCIGDAVCYAIMCHFEELNNAALYHGKIVLRHGEREIVINNELDIEAVPFKFIIEENPDDYWGTCTAKNLPCDRVSI